jgi:hypothetical protein
MGPFCNGEAADLRLFVVGERGRRVRRTGERSSGTGPVQACIAAFFQKPLRIKAD